MSFEQALELHTRFYGVEPDVAAFAPGRINLIGEHTDYSGGWVMPAAISLGIYGFARVVAGESRVLSNIAGPGKPFCSEAVKPNQVTGFARYIAGMAWALRDQTAHVPELEITIFSDLPVGAGVSSSAALEVLAGKLYALSMGKQIEEFELAKLAQKCEREFVGVPCGLMDQMAVACGKRNQAILFDTETHEMSFVPLAGVDIAVVVLDTKIPRSLASSAYGKRTQEVAEASKIMGIEKLRYAECDLLEKNRQQLGDLLFKRARHVITENARVLEFAKRLPECDENAIFALMKASHDSLKKDYEVSCSGLDAMCEAAWTTSGVLGCRMTGAGFGGCCVALVRAEQAEEAVAEILSKYSSVTGKCGEGHIVTVSRGVCGSVLSAL